MRTPPPISPLPRFKEWRFWSIGHDAWTVRLMCAAPEGSMYPGREYFALIAAGKGYRDRREEALALIGEAIERGDKPGEVRI